MDAALQSLREIASRLLSGLPEEIPAAAEGSAKAEPRAWPLGTSDSLLEALLQQLPVGVGLVDAAGRYVVRNPALTRLVGEMIPALDPERIRTWRAWKPDGTALDSNDWPIMRALRGEVVHPGVEFRHPNPEGREVWSQVAAAPFFDPSGEIAGAITVVEDITAKKQADEAKAQLAYYAQLLMNVEDAVIATDTEYRIKAWNRGAEKLFGWSAEEILGRPAYEVLRSIVSDEERRELVMRLAEFGSTRLEVIVHHRDGTPIHAEAINSILRDQEGRINGYVAISRDIGERMKAERALRESEEQFRTMFNVSSVGMAQADPVTRRFLHVNVALCRIAGYTEGELLSMSVDDLNDPEDNERDRELYRSLAHGDRSEYHLEQRYVRKDGRVIWVHSTCNVVRDENGSPLRMVALVQDVTARKEAEAALHELKDTLEERVAERTALLEQRNRDLKSFAFVASHDLQEPLRKIRSFSTLLGNESGESLDEQSRYYLQRIETAAARMSKLLADVLAFSLIATPEQPFRKVELKRLVEEVLADLDLVLAESDAEVEVHADVSIEADPGQIRQLLTHLIQNAVKFRREGTPLRLVIKASLYDSGPSRAIRKKQCRITVEDNGIGIDPQYADRIFEPFERLHGLGQFPGTGMGLAICRRIVERHGGSIRAESVPGGGCRLIAILPANGSVASDSAQ